MSPSQVLVELLAASCSSTATTCVDLLEGLSAEVVAQTSAGMAGLQKLPASAAVDKAAAKCCLGCSCPGGTCRVQRAHTSRCPAWRSC